MARKPDSHDYEHIWYEFWEQKGYFDGQKAVSSKPKFTMLLPPPNITGNLHLGHALTVSIQDAIFRYKHMTGHDCLWIPGFDHAGIATQIILDKVLRKERDISTRDLSTQEFIEYSQKWKESRTSDIKSQLARIGSCLAFDREFYTLDSVRSKAVNEAFIQLFNDGLIYRDKTPVNWSFFLKSTLSEIEIKWLHIKGPEIVDVPGYGPVEFGKFHMVSYPLFNDMSGRSITVATTRVQTIVGDVAIAVNPKDVRYSDMIGQQVIHPLTGEKLPIVAHEEIDMSVGTGAMKVTPLTSGIDFEIAKLHNLKGREVLDDNGCIKCSNLREEYQHLNGTHRYDAIKKIIDILTKIGSYRGSEPHETTIPVCIRSGDVIETMVKEQWFVKSNELSKRVEESINSGQIRITAENYKKVWLNWFKLQDKDWCISRQIKWGHRIPAYVIYADGKKTGHWVVGNSINEAMIRASEIESLNSAKVIDVKQDDDVLDTWFSSALLPYSVFDDQAEGHKYPLSVMETGYDILAFWVNRMVMLCLHMKKELPFNNVILHGMVSDARGKKMTKSLGNVIDPLDVVRGTSLDDLLKLSDQYYEKGLLTLEQLESAKSGQRQLFPNGIPKCGADALRLCLIQKNFHHQQIHLDIKKISGNRHMINKLWQTVKFLELNLKKFNQAAGPEGHNMIGLGMNEELKSIELNSHDKWILSSLSSFVTRCNQVMDQSIVHLETPTEGEDDVDRNPYMRMDLIYESFTDFWIAKMCDVYVEHIKESNGQLLDRLDIRPRDVSKSINIFIHCMQTSLKLMHPFAPFITEELYQRIKMILMSNASLETAFDGGSILDEEYPKDEDYKNWFMDHKSYPDGHPKNDLKEKSEDDLVKDQKVKKLKRKKTESSGVQ